MIASTSLRSLASSAAAGRDAPNAMAPAQARTQSGARSERNGIIDQSPVGRSVLPDLRRSVTHDIVSLQPARGSFLQSTLGSCSQLPGSTKVAFVKTCLRRSKVGVWAVTLASECNRE